MPRLRRVEPYTSPGYRRVGRGRGFAYVHDDGSSASRTERARITELAIPPAWSDVWIADVDNAHVLAVGVDAAGRRQYLYHPAWRERQDGEKFERMTLLAAALPRARRGVLRDLAGVDPVRERTLAAAFRTLDLAGIRIGSEESLAGARSRGLTTLLVRNATLDGVDMVRLRFTAKGGIAQNVSVHDTALGGFVQVAAERSPRSRLYAWQEGRRMRALSPGEVNDDIRDRTGGDFTAKDFRTLRGTIVAAERLAEIGVLATESDRADAIRNAIEATSAALGNTPTIARDSYIDPRVFAAYEADRVIGRRGSRESALLRLLVEPE